MSRRATSTASREVEAGAQIKADLREQELVGEIVKPAEADAERTRVQAAAKAEAMTVKATAAASNNRVALDRMLIEQLPEIVEKAAVGLSHANVNVLEGADGLANITAGLLSQGMIVYESARKMWAENGDAPDETAAVTRKTTPTAESIGESDAGQDGPSSTSGPL